jgi:uncharacterized protein (UPF0147 family)
MSDSESIIRLLRRIENDPLVARCHRNAASQAMRHIKELQQELEDAQSGRLPT